MRGTLTVVKRMVIATGPMIVHQLPHLAARANR